MESQHIIQLRDLTNGPDPLTLEMKYRRIPASLESQLEGFA